MNEDSKTILQLLSVKKIKPSDLIGRLRKNAGDMKKTLRFYNTFFNSSRSLFKLPEENNALKIKNILKILEINRADAVNISQNCYPALLKEIFFPPPIIFYKGARILKNNLCVAVVGTRKSTSYGRDAAKYFAKELAQLGITIVSGMASGIDYYAHKASINEKGSSIAVLGCGIDVIYPPENKELFFELGEKGSIITEFLPGTPPKKNNFPARNRIISGICAGVLVIEAPEKSGALITCNFAADQDREVFAIPGSIFSRETMGNHSLIKNGAKLASNIDDILEEISNFYCVLKESESCKIKKSIQNEAGNTMYVPFKKTDLPDTKEVSRNTSKIPCILDSLDTRQKKVHDFIGYKPVSFEEIVLNTGFEIAEVLSIISQLEFNNLISEKNLNQFVRIC